MIWGGMSSESTILRSQFVGKKHSVETWMIFQVKISGISDIPWGKLGKKVRVHLSIYRQDYHHWFISRHVDFCDKRREAGWLKNDQIDLPLCWNRWHSEINRWQIVDIFCEKKNNATLLAHPSRAKMCKEDLSIFGFSRYLRTVFPSWEMWKYFLHALEVGIDVSITFCHSTLKCCPN